MQMKTTAKWWDEIEAIVAEKSLLKHAFYRAWTGGELSRADLAHYARQYYQQESRFPRFVSAVHAACPELKVRQALLENLNQEEAGPDNHPELWLRFAGAVGVSRKAMASARADKKTAACVAEFESLCRGERWQEGLAALYAYESQQPAVAKTKIQGLKSFYGVESSSALEFFRTHQEADVWHSGVEKKILREQVAREPGLAGAVKKAVARACDAMNVLLDGVCDARGIPCAPSMN